MRPPAPCSSSRWVLATFQPLFSPPMSENAGTRTPSKKTVFFTPLSVPPSPPVPMSCMGCTSRPGRFASIMNQARFSCRRPLGSVHAMSQMRSAPLSLPTKIFCPVRTYSSPSRRAVMLTLARSEPAPGSLRSCHVRTWPV